MGYCIITISNIPEAAAVVQIDKVAAEKVELVAAVEPPQQQALAVNKEAAVEAPQAPAANVGIDEEANAIMPMVAPVTPMANTAPVAPIPRLNFLGLSKFLQPQIATDNHLQNDKKKTFLNVEYESQNSTHHAQIPMHKDEFAETRGYLNSSRIVDLQKSKH
ncbi:hypothetical protein B9Z55_028731 [Caenorhabditis nigoni]|uniref:Uncharacterized protein n=1 Tax=Caenorhabditis nigoni TaxID=1611254 RepID=A0A2G5SAR1_9PELO|nr:hypothetical protein B9Z55_028731 [Caenorhabditis nigoni]